MTIDAPAGAQDIQLEFPMPFSNKIGYTLLLMSFFAIGGLVYLGRQ
jgi:hypothetical protein